MIQASVELTDDGYCTGQPIVAVTAVLEHKGTILLLKKPDPADPALAAAWPGMWTLPGGKLSRGESPVRGLAREIHEETGISIIESRFAFDMVTAAVSPRMHVVCLVYRARVAAYDRAHAVNREPHKHEQLGWFPYHDLPRPLMPGLADWIAAKLAMKG